MSDQTVCYYRHSLQTQRSVSLFDKNISSVCM